MIELNESRFQFYVEVGNEALSEAEVYININDEVFHMESSGDVLFSTQELNLAEGLNRVYFTSLTEGKWSRLPVVGEFLIAGGANQSIEEFSLITPEFGHISDSESIEFAWEDYNYESVKYNLIISDNPNFSNPIDFRELDENDIQVDMSQIPPGLYYWKVIASGNSNKNSREIFQFVSNYENTITGIRQNKVEKGIKVYPNPFVDKLSINSNNPNLGDLDLKVFDTTGQLIKSIDSFDENSINLSELRNGLYILRIETKSFTTFRRITKE
jgi:hypothetical protein